MRKRDELTNPASCMSRAKDDEMTFVLLGRDVAAPVAIRAWIAARIRLGKNAMDDAQIIEALACARVIEEEAARAKEPPPEHRYTSTACQHDRHADCRQRCKFCDTACLCECHRAKETGG